MLTMVFGCLAGFFLLGGIAMFFANQRVDAPTKRSRWLKYGVYVLIVHLVIGSALAGALYFSLLMLLVAGLGAVELFRLYRLTGCTRQRLPIMLLSGGIYLALASGLLMFAVHTPAATVIFVYLTVATFDGFSQVTGQLLGKHRLAPRISPHKTIEGTFGGLLAAVAIAILLRSLAGLSFGQAGSLAVYLSLAGLCGDLAASWCKRLHGVKDFGHLLPGHGGVLDRFDSLLAAGSAFWLYTRFLV